MIKKVISGGQIGADLAGVMSGLYCKIPTGGWMPKGFKNLDGLNPSFNWLFGIQEHKSDKYPPRTFQNAKEADGTIRLAKDFTSPGEKLTLKAVNQYKKVHFDVDIDHENNISLSPNVVAEWIIKNNIEILNIAGNAKKEIEKPIFFFLNKVFLKVNE